MQCHVSKAALHERQSLPGYHDSSIEKGTYQVKRLLGTILEVGTQAGFQILGRHIPLGLHCLLTTATAIQLAQVQCCPVSYLQPSKQVAKLSDRSQSRAAARVSSRQAGVGTQSQDCANELHKLQTPERMQDLV